MGSASVVPEENVISAIRSASGSNLPTNSIAAACTAGKAPNNDPDRSMTKDMSTSRRVAVASADIDGQPRAQQDRHQEDAHVHQGYALLPRVIHPLDGHPIVTSCAPARGPQKYATE